MKKLYCVICGKYRKFKNHKTCVSEKTLVLFIICSKCEMKRKIYLDTLSS